jgi:hypothetical protein
MNQEKFNSKKISSEISEQGSQTDLPRQVKAINGDAFTYLKSLPRPELPETLDIYREKDPSRIIEKATAGEYTDRYRSANSIDIPICWSFDKDALINLLGITSYEHYPEVNGVRFYAGVNPNGLLTLVAVSTTTGTREGCSDCRNDLTVDDEYPYYDYADPCPTNCSETGNLRAASSNDECVRSFKKN